jgi:hypothetical protein
LEELMTCPRASCSSRLRSLAPVWFDFFSEQSFRRELLLNIAIAHLCHKLSNVYHPAPVLTGCQPGFKYSLRNIREYHQ